jgi:hypothetical protein
MLQLLRRDGAKNPIPMVGLCDLPPIEQEDARWMGHPQNGALLSESVQGLKPVSFYGLYRHD